MGAQECKMLTAENLPTRTNHNHKLIGLIN